MQIIGIVAIAIICLNLLVVLLTFFRVWFVSNIYFGITTAFFALMVIITSPNFKINFGGQDRTFRIPVFPGTAFFRFALICSLILSITFTFLGEEFINTLQTKKKFLINKVSSDLDNETFKDRIYLLDNSGYYDSNLNMIGKIVTEMEVLLKDIVSLPRANEKMALIIFKNPQGNFVKGYEAYVPLSALKKKTSKPKSQSQAFNQKYNSDDKSKDSLSKMAKEFKVEKERTAEEEKEKQLKLEAERWRQQLVENKKIEEERRLKQKAQKLTEHRKRIEIELKRLIAQEMDKANWQPKTVWTEELNGKNIFVYYNENNLNLTAKIIKRVKRLGGRGDYILRGEDNSCSCPVSEICYSFRDLNAATALQASLFDIIPTRISSFQTQGRITINIGG